MAWREAPRRIAGRRCAPPAVQQSRKTWHGYGQILKIPVLNVIPDPGNLSYCMHTCPERNDGFTMVHLTHTYVYFDMECETLKLICCGFYV